MKLKLTTISLLILLLLASNSACYIENTGTISKSTQSEPEEENIDEEYFEEINRIFKRGLPNAIDEYYIACDDLLKYDISLPEHKEATSVIVRRIYVLSNAFDKLEPPDKAKEVHIIYGNAMDHYYNSTDYLLEYIKSNDINNMNSSLEQSISEIEKAAKYLNEANEKMKNIN